MEQDYNSIEGTHQSALKKILKHPQEYLNALQRDNGPQAIWFIKGHIVEDMVLQPKKDLEEEYYINKDSPLGDKLKEVIDRVYENSPSLKSLEDDGGYDAVLLACQQTGYQSNWKANTKYDKIVNEGSMYHKMLFERTGKTIINFDDYSECRLAAANLQSDKFVKPILEDKSRLTKVILQYELLGINMVSEVDFLTIDHERKHIKPYDMKTMSKPIYMFKSQYTSLGYDFQDVVYQKALEICYPGYTVDPVRFVVVQLGSSISPLIFQGSKELRNEAIENVKDAINRLKFHTKIDSWDYPMESYTSNGIITIV